MVTPYLHLSANFLSHNDTELRELKAASVAAVINGLQGLVKKACKFIFDNDKIIIEDSTGRAALKASFDRDGSITFWSARTGTSIGCVEGKTIDAKRQLCSKTIEDWANKAADGMVRCNECGRWVNIYQPYSYAGAVCNDCYNPKKHLAPDTRGE
jgi:hypothetical protein